MERADRILILGSAPDALRARDFPRAGVDRIVAINNAWAVRPDWDALIRPSDFPAERMPPARPAGAREIGHEDYVPAVNAFGGFVFGGGTMAFTAGYWALQAFRPRLIAYLGCDMDYSDAGATHFYGRGRADPLRPDPTLRSLEAKAARLQTLAAERGCAVVNLSIRPMSRLTFPRLPAQALPGWDAAASARLCAALLGPEARRLAAEARAREAALGYATPDGRYWKTMERWDPAALDAVDALWRAAAGGRSAAA
jgi:hypothetical protein